MKQANIVLNESACARGEVGARAPWGVLIIVGTSRIEGTECCRRSKIDQSAGAADFLDYPWR